MPVSSKLISRIFKSREILSAETFYKFTDRKKIVVFVPLNFVELLTSEMSKAGAGLIGNYTMCSFRTSGTGTFMPGKHSKPFAGKKNILSRESEIKLEMECDPDKVNPVIDALLENHPYEETAYEIYDFRKRDKKESGVIVRLKSKMSLQVLMNRVNSKLILTGYDLNDDFKSIAVISMDSTNDETISESAKFTKCEYVLYLSNKKYKLSKL